MASLAVVGIGLALYRVSNAWKWDRVDYVDNTTLLYLLLPIVAGLLPFVDEFSLTKDGISWKRRIEESVEATLNKVDTAQDRLEMLTSAVQYGVGKTRPTVSRASVTDSVAPNLAADSEVSEGERTPPATSIDPDDPQRGRWGGQATANGRRLSAVVRAIKGDRRNFRVDLKVEAIPGSPPLSGKAILHLHPTFDPDILSVPVVDGVAEVTLISYGAFTVGAEADGGKTRLELNLAELPDAPKVFREN